jgi:membrane-bound lytic murein transglycosylase F
MWRRVLDTVLIPLLFVAVASAAMVYVAGVASGCDTSAIVRSNKGVCEDKFLISPYDTMFQRIGAKYNIDWVLLSAIARAESEFKFDAVSKAGAVGLMQIMPSTARSMGYEREQLFDAEISAEVAAQLLHENNKMLRLSQSFDPTERLNFILACYNAGYSRIADARRLARFHEDDANKWSVVASYLALLAEPEFAEHEVVQSGEFFGSDETIEYVGKVMHLYNIYTNRITKL